MHDAIQGSGGTTCVGSVEETIPPMATVVSGRCTSDPIPVLSAIGTNPSDATSAVSSRPALSFHLTSALFGLPVSSRRARVRSSSQNWVR